MHDFDNMTNNKYPIEKCTFPYLKKPNCEFYPYTLTECERCRWFEHSIADNYKKKGENNEKK